MVAKLTKGFWPKVAGIILRNRILILLGVAAFTVFLAMQWKNMRFSNTEANILPDDHPASIQYNAFTKIFGEEGNAIVLAIRDSALFTPKNFNQWNTLSKQLDAFPEVEYVISLENLKELIKDNDTQTFSMEPLITTPPTTKTEIDSLTNHLFKELPFYDNLVYNAKSGTIQTVVYLDKDIMNTAVRNEFILNDLAELVEDFEQETGMDVRISGMPYIRTWNTKSIVDEIGLFIVGALLVTSIIFFFFFRSFRATFISMCVVIIGVMWAFGILGLLKYEITILTALIPLDHCNRHTQLYFLINKYQQEVKKHGNQALSLQRVISKIGNATLMTNITTASGFATFIILDSDLLKEFGIVASINIVGIFILSLLIIPIIYSFMPLPKTKHLKHLNKKWMDIFVNWMENMVRNHRIAVYITTVAVLVLSIIGIYQMRITGSRIEDLPKKSHFYKDIQFFEAEFDGIMPMEIVVDTKRKNGVIKPATLKRMDGLGTVIDEIPELSRPISVVDLVKYSKQAFYNGIPKYYQLPTSQENTFIMNAVQKSSTDGTDLLQSFVDSTGQTARLTTYMRDVKIDRMEEIEKDLQEAIAKQFPSERYDVFMTGKALLFLKGTKYLVKNLLLSLALAIGLISLFMAYLFRSYKMVIISLVPNLLPLVITAGVMGYLGVPIKPSTILVFSIAFGISVDDTIHFLAKYRQELTANRWHIKKSVYAALRETGVSMFYTSIVLFFGFSVFIISSFGGTKALGGLVSATLLFAMLSNLILLPSLLLSLERSIANKQVLKKPQIDILPQDEDNLKDK